MNSPTIITGMAERSDWHGATGWSQLKKSTDLPTTTASMNMAMPMGSRSSTSMSRMVRDTAMEALP